MQSEVQDHRFVQAQRPRRVALQPAFPAIIEHQLKQHVMDMSSAGVDPSMLEPAIQEVHNTRMELQAQLTAIQSQARTGWTDRGRRLLSSHPPFFFLLLLILLLLLLQATLPHRDVRARVQAQEPAQPLAEVAKELHERSGKSTPTSASSTSMKAGKSDSSKSRRFRFSRKERKKRGKFVAVGLLVLLACVERKID
jgi:hypothetical protein